MLSKLRNRLAGMWRRRLSRSGQESGQSLIILAFAFLGLIAMLGIALDLGLVYVERVRLKRAVDASVLGGVVELPFEEDAANRAMEYLELNGYDLSNAEVVMRGCVRDVQDYYSAGIYQGCPGCGDGDRDELINAGSDASHPAYTYTNIVQPSSFFEINTYDYQGEDHAAACDASSTPPSFGTANKLEVTGTVYVDMNFMQFFGFREVPVTDNALAQNVDNLDVAIVFDRSGSMEYDNVCLGCWERTETAGPHAGDDPHYFGYYDYPEDGIAYPLSFTDLLITRACASSPPASETYYDDPGDTYKYIIIEGELYSANTSVVDTAFREGGKGYWVIQRGIRDYPNGSTGTNATMGMYVGHHPDITFHSGGTKLGDFYTLGDAQTGNAPQLSYDFSFHPSAGWGAGAKYVWVRAWASGDIGTGGPRDDNNTPNYDTLYWQIQDLTAGSSTAVTQDNGARSGQWTWVRLGSVSDTSHQYRLNVWAGSSGIGLDRIVITDNPNSTGNGGDGSTLRGARTANATAGSARRAGCDACNPIYGLTIGPGTSYPTCSFFETPISPTNTLDPAKYPMWADEEAPLRSAKEAIKVFIQRLDPKYDQVGLVSFNDTVAKESELECLQRYGRAQCVEGSNPISFTNVLKEVEDLEARNATHIASGMKAGMEILGLNPYNVSPAPVSFGRGGAASKVMILMTDGTPCCPDTTAHPGGACAASDWYPNAAHPNRIDIRYNGSNGYDCVLWFAEYAKDHGVTLYIIGLGFAVDPELLKEAAERGNGLYFFSATGSDLDFIFEQILQNIYVRLIR